MPELYIYQKQCVAQLLAGKKIVYAGMGLGKNPISMVWAGKKCEQTGKRKILVVTTASKAKTNDHANDLTSFYSPLQNSLSSLSLSVISWHKLARWAQDYQKEIKDFVFVFDECLPADTLVKTNKGEKEIASLSVGDKVLSYNHDTHKLEYKKITRTIKKPSPNKMIRLLLSNGITIISTGNHPHFTQNGYKNAEDIKIGDVLYETRSICETKSDKRKGRKIWGVYTLCHLWKRDKRCEPNETPKRQVEDEKGKLLFDSVWKNSNEREWKEADVQPETKRITKDKSCAEDDDSQPLTRQRENSKSTNNKEKDGVATDMGVATRLEGWQWKVYRTAKNLVEETKRGKQRVGDGTTSFVDLETARFSKQLQVGHWKRLLQNRNRVRRRQSQLSQNKSERQKEGEEIRGIRVASVEVLKLRDIKRLGFYRDTDNVYCIDVKDNHNFFANGILTHNCQRCGAGVSSGMGRAFLKITKETPNWAGFTGTPGDTWLKFYPYFTACNLVRNKTSFMREYAEVQTYKGYPEIVSWRNEGKLQRMWAQISYAPDTKKATQELPKSVNRPIMFSLPKTYHTVLKTRYNADGDFLDTAGALTAELRRICFTKDKQEWMKDFVQDVDRGAVIFYNYVATGDMLEEIITNALGKEGKIWRIDGKHHDIPTAETIGKKDMVLCQWQSGSEALNLQMLNYMVMVELPYSYSTLKQGMGRIRRLGQTQTMFFYTLLCEKGIEQDVKKILSAKGEFSIRNWCASNNITMKGEYGNKD